MRAAVKIFITLVSAAALCVAVALSPQKLAFECGDSYTFFVGDSSKNCKVITVTSGAELKKLTLTDVCGEATSFKSLNLQSFLKSVNGEIVFEETLSDSVNYYCTADLPYSVTLYGKRINLHICVKEQGVTVASPIIFGGY